ncbi:hypothetical protein [Thermincola ferriacetica]
MFEDGEGRREVLACQNGRRPAFKKCSMSHRVRGHCIVVEGLQLRLIGGEPENRHNALPGSTTDFTKKPLTKNQAVYYN